MKTSLGISEQWYKHTNDYPIFGTGQGSGNSPAIWCFVCSALFDAFQSTAHGATFNSYSNDLILKLHMVGFVDDCTQRVNQFQATTQPPPETLIRLMQHDAQLWNDLLWASGGALEQSKCSFHLIQSSWTPDGHPFLTGGKSHLVLNLEHDGVVTPTLQKSNYESHKTLGCHVSPAKCDTKTWMTLKDKNNEFAELLETNYFTRQEARTFYTSIYLPSITYPLPITPLKKEQCGKLDARFLRALVPRCGYNRNMSAAIRFAPVVLGGAGFKQLYVEQGSLIIQQIFKFLNHPHSQIGQMLHITLSWTQAFLGTSKPILEEVHHPIPPSGPSILLDARKFLQEIGGKIVVQKSYTCPVLRVNDQHIMDLAMHQKSWTNRQLIQINSCRRYTQAQSLADITNLLGNRILPQVYNPSSPPHPTTIRIAQFNQQRPGNTAWRTWRKFLLTISDANGILRVPLQQWIKQHHELRHWPKYVYNPHTDTLYSHFRDELYQQHDNITKEIFSLDPQGPIRPAHGYPIHTFHINGTLRILKNYIIRQTAYTIPPATNDQVWPHIPLPTWEQDLLQSYQLHTTVPELVHHLQHGNVISCSDGSATKEYGTYGYILATKEGQRLARGRGIAPGAHPNSFRSEAYGVLATLRLLVRMTEDLIQTIPPTLELEHWLDNRSVITRINRTLESRYMTASRSLMPEQDVIEEAAHSIQQLPFQVRLKWTQGHQDRLMEYDKLPLPAQLNCDADREAAHPDLQRSPHPTIATPLPHTPCQFIIRNKSITSQLKRRVHRAAQTPALMQYLETKFGWDPAVTNSIDWDIFSEIIIKYKDKWTTIVKHLHDVSPTGKIAHRNNHLLPHHCPACMEPFEDNTHVITCNHPSRREWRTTTIHRLRQINNNKTDPYLLDILHDGLGRFHHQCDPIPPHTYPDKYHKAIETQTAIGWGQLYKGRWSTEWAKLHNAYITSHPSPLYQTGQLWVRSTGRYLIDQWLVLWTLRNEQRHGADQSNQTRIRRERVVAELEELYALKSQVCPMDKSLFHDTIQIHMANHPSTEILEDWVSTYKAAIKASVNQAIRLGIQGNRRIYEYPTHNPSSQADS